MKINTKFENYALFSVLCNLMFTAAAAHEQIQLSLFGGWAKGIGSTAFRSTVEVKMPMPMHVKSTRTNRYCGIECRNTEFTSKFDVNNKFCCKIIVGYFGDLAEFYRF